jgi:hypothetical protein
MIEGAYARKRHRPSDQTKAATEVLDMSAIRRANPDIDDVQVPGCDIVFAIPDQLRILIS